MTQEYRWLAALALLLALGAGAVRAEEEDDVVRPSAHSVAELLPPPRPVVAEPSQVVVMPAPPWQNSFAPPWASFILPNPFPCPGPAPTCPYAPVAVPCPCAAGTCPMPAGLWRPLTQEASQDVATTNQYVVTVKMVKGDDEDAEVTACPRVSVFENQTATLHLQGYETANERSSLQIQMTLSRQGQGAQMDLAMTEASSHDGEGGLRSHTETTETRCNVPFGKPYKMDLKEGARLEVTVTQVEQEQRVHQAACAGCGGMCRDLAPLTEMDADDSPMDAAGEIVGCLCQVLNDAADSAFGWVFSTEDDAEPPSSAYLEHPPQYLAPNPAFPLTRELATQEGCTASCPKSEGGCTQCAVLSGLKKPETHLSIDAMHDRKKLDVTHGGKHWTAEADAITLHEDCILLQGHVVAESSDDCCHESMVIKADTIRLERKDGGLKIHVEGNATTPSDD